MTKNVEKYSVVGGNLAKNIGDIRIGLPENRYILGENDFQEEGYGKKLALRNGTN